MNKNILIVIVAVAVLVLAGVWFWSRQSSAPNPASFPGEQTQQPNDTTGSIQADLNALDLGDVDKEFQGIDADVNSL